MHTLAFPQGNGASQRFAIDAEMALALVSGGSKRFAKELSQKLFQLIRVHRMTYRNFVDSGQ